MALFATHLRFAVDLVETVGVADLSHYISGTNYPDSRWLTHVDRSLTHGSIDFERYSVSEDFLKGWQVHCQCDHIQNQMFKELFPEFFKADAEDTWVGLSALKVVQDTGDTRFSSTLDLPMLLSRVANPNGEALSRIQRFYDMIISIYHGVERVSPESYAQLWRDVGVQNDLITKIMALTGSLLENASLLETVRRIHKRMLSSFRPSS